MRQDAPWLPSSDSNGEIHTRRSFDRRSRDKRRARRRVQDADRLAALSRTGLLDAGPDDTLDRLTRLATRVLGIPVALVSLVAAERQYFAGAAVCRSRMPRSGRPPLPIPSASTSSSPASL